MRQTAYPPKIFAFLVGRAVHRRRLSTGQRAAVTARDVKHFEAGAKKRQLAGLKQNQQADSVVAIFPERDIGRAREKAAEMFNVSPRSVATTKKDMGQDTDTGRYRPIYCSARPNM